ncbi:sugar ABC transporter ATP-binding protein [Lutibaculum baratangense]|uniref:Ribose ABC transport system, ATP-binding protein RbsA n=1 Tax=Lutibaculum baratangense AMV1 TaxID=631454 RepID=V4RMM8_9HYPH|nr:sugar ABC transporter ATP-binding protein [Lutibaculum baratangense]ESR27281.1 Ribose ABC transport system, ATP-binding protein RbsA [Lutibaculum baratangense AMV1]
MGVAVSEGRLTSPVLSAEKVSKSFGPVQVLFHIDFELRPGEVHALIGENGAGKSTLMKTLSGYERPTGGRILLDGQEVQFVSGADAEDRGVVLIHQEFNLADQLSVEANIFLGREPRRGPFLDSSRMREEARALLAELETNVDPQTRVMHLPVSDKQMVEIAKALSRKARVLIMDEPTAVLTANESRTLFRQIERLKREGVAILYTSHKLEEVKEIADVVTVLRDGHHVVTAPTSELSVDDMARHMVGRELVDLYPEKAPQPAAETVLEVSGFSVLRYAEDVSFTLKRGEILGFAGLVGSGRTELMEGLVGLRPAHGEVKVHGEVVHIRSPKDAERRGVAYLTEDRKGRGLILNQEMRPNLTLFGLDRFCNIFIDRRREEEALDQATQRFDIRAPHRRIHVGHLSGGNQQKLLLAKTMVVEPDIVIIDEPTRGIDIGTKQQIYNFVEDLARQGKSCILVSSEMAEIIGLCHRVVVMRSGRVMGELSAGDINENNIVRHAMGLSHNGGGRHDARH